MAMKPAKKPAVKASASPKKSTTTPKTTTRGGPGAPGKNVSKGALNPASSDKAFQAHKKAIADARAQYKEIDRLYQANPLGRLFSGNLNQYNKDFAEVESTLKKLQSADKSFVKAGYKPQFATPGNKKA